MCSANILKCSLLYISHELRILAVEKEIQREMEESKLIKYSFQYHLHNNSPVELNDFTGALQSLASEFNRVNKSKGKIQLYIRTIEHGSIIVDLVEYVGVAMLGFPEVAPLFVSFAEELWDKIKRIQKRENILHITTDELKDIINILKPVQPSGNELSMRVMDNEAGVVYNNCTFNVTNIQARNVYNIGSEEVARRKEEEVSEKEYTELLSVQQLRAGTSKVGTYGVIDRFGDKAVKLLFEDDKVKSNITDIADNPLKKLFFVRMKPKTSEGKIRGYLILEVLDIIEEE